MHADYWTQVRDKLEDEMEDKSIVSVEGGEMGQAGAAAETKQQEWQK